jgi:hypothetical protein
VGLSSLPELYTLRSRLRGEPVRYTENDRSGLVYQSFMGSFVVLLMSVLFFFWVYASGSGFGVSEPSGGFLGFALGLLFFVWVLAFFFVSIWVPLLALMAWFLRLQASGRDYEQSYRSSERVGVRLSIIFWTLGCVLFTSLVVPGVHERRWGAGSFLARVSSSWSLACEDWIEQIRGFFSGSSAKEFENSRLRVLVGGDLLSEGGWEPLGFTRIPVLVNVVAAQEEVLGAITEAAEDPAGPGYYFSDGVLVPASQALESPRASSGRADFRWESWFFERVPFLLGWLWFLDHVPVVRDVFPAYLGLAADDRRALRRFGEGLSSLPADFAGSVVLRLAEGEAGYGKLRLQSGEEANGRSQSGLSRNRSARTHATAALLKKTLDRFSFGKALISPLASSLGGSGSGLRSHFSSLSLDHSVRGARSKSDWVLFDARSQRFIVWSPQSPCHVLPMLGGLELEDAAPSFVGQALERLGVGIDDEMALAQRFLLQPTFWCLVPGSAQGSERESRHRMIVGALPLDRDRLGHGGVAGFVEWSGGERSQVRRGEKGRTLSERHGAWGDHRGPQIPDVQLFEAKWSGDSPEVLWNRLSVSESTEVLGAWLAALLVNPSLMADELAEVLRFRAFGG